MDRQEYRQLAQAAADGDASAFSRLYELLYREMYYSAYYSLADEADTLEVITGTLRDTNAAVGRLRTEEAFVTFLMKTLCSRIQSMHREYAAENRRLYSDEESGFDVKREFLKLPDNDRLVASLYIGGKFQPDEIALYTGFSGATVQKAIERAVAGFELD